jgi:hypothetical protein
MASLVIPPPVNVVPSAMPTRPITEEEQQQVRRLLKAPRIAVPRALVGILRVGGLGLAGLYLAGVPIVPDVLAGEVFGAGLLALLFGVVALQLSKDVRRVLRYGEVVDVSAPVAERPSAPRGLWGLGLGAWRVFVSARVGQGIQTGTEQRVTVAVGLPEGRHPGYGRVMRGLWLAVKGQPVRAPSVVFFEPGAVASASNGFASNAVAVPYDPRGPKKKARGRGVPRAVVLPAPNPTRTRGSAGLARRRTSTGGGAF